MTNFERTVLRGGENCYVYMVSYNVTKTNFMYSIICCPLW
jgi:hypothetical protein